MLWIALLLLWAIGTIILLSARYKLNVFFVLLIVAACTGLLAGLDIEKVLSLLKAGIGGTLEKIGLLIVLGITLGILLEKSGATHSLSKAILDRTGQSKAPLALSIMGYTVGLPIFCDSGFVVLSGVLRSLSARAPAQQLWMTVALASGLYSVHCLVPPHPGITAAAGTLQADIGQLMLLGAVVAIPVALTGYWGGWWFNQRYGGTSTDVHLPEAIEQDRPLPHPLLCLLPILVPVLLIGLKSVLALLPDMDKFPFWRVVRTTGDPIVALFVGILLCLPLFSKLSGTQFNSILDTALSKSGNILLLTAAGGAFGEVIKALDLGAAFGPVLSASGLGLLVPFLMAMLFKTAQGSSTVAVISTTGILAPLLPTLGLATGTEHVLALLAMGSGSMACSHTNDSYFWVVAKFGHIETDTALKSYTLITGAMAVAGFLSVWCLQIFL